MRKYNYFFPHTIPPKCSVWAIFPIYICTIIMCASFNTLLHIRLQKKEAQSSCLRSFSFTLFPFHSLATASVCLELSENGNKKRSQKKRMWNNSPFHTALITKYFQSQGVVIFSSNFSVLTGVPNITNFLFVKQANISNSTYKGF